MVRFLTGHVSTRIGSGFLLLVFLMLCCAGTGFYGMSKLGDILGFISGPAWSNADSIMNGVIKIEAQMLAVRQLQTSKDTSAILAKIDLLGNEASESFIRFEEQKLMPGEVYSQRKNLQNAYNESLSKVIASFHSLQQAPRLTERQLELSSLRKDLGKSLATLTNRSQPEESSQTSASDFTQTLGDFDILLFDFQAFLSQKPEDLSSSLGSFSQISESVVGKCQSLSLAAKNLTNRSPEHAKLTKQTEALNRVLIGYVDDCKQIVTATSNVHDQNQEFESKAESLLSYIDSLEEKGDAIVDDAAAGVGPLQRSMSLLVLFFATISVVVSAIAATVCTRAVVSPLRQIVSALTEFGDGNLTRRLELARTDEFGQMASAYNNAAGKIQSMVKKLSLSSKSLACSANQIASSAHSISDGVNRTNQQTTIVNDVARSLSDNMTSVSTSSETMTHDVGAIQESLNEMTSTIVEISSVTQRYNTDVAETSALAVTTNVRMQELLKATDAIGNVVQLIEDLADQTNLLALNATIEAARAGESGKGFAVVATEVKDLAKQTAAATSDIRKSIESVQRASQDAVNSIELINTMINGMSETSNRIAAAIEEQSVTTRSMANHMTSASNSVTQVAGGIRQTNVASQRISVSIAEVEKVSNQSAAGASQFVDAGQQLQRLANEVEELVHQFQIA